MLIKTYELWPGRHDVTLTVFIHTSDHIFASKNKRPAIICCSGGGFIECSRDGDGGDHVAMSFASDGYNAFVLQYSSADRSKKEDVLFPSQMYDLGKAILMIRQHADEWKTDPDKITIVGFSAGACICALYATTYHQDHMLKKLNAATCDLEISAALLIYGIYDFKALLRYQNEHPAPDGINAGPDGIQCIFGQKNPSKEQLERYSPICQVSSMTPPLFLAAAIDDPAIPAVQTLDMAKKCHEEQIPYEVHVFQRGGHGFSLGRYLADEYRQDKALSCSAWVPMAKTFLTHLFAPESAEHEPDFEKLMKMLAEGNK